MAVVTAGARPLREPPSTAARNMGRGSPEARFAVFDLDRTLERICDELVDAARGELQADLIEVAQAVAPLLARRLFPGARWLSSTSTSIGATA